MPRPSTLENPFTPEKHRSTDDPALVGKILGPEAEAAMRKGMKPQEEQKPEGQADLALTDAERAQSIEEQKRREIIRNARKDLIAWANEIGKDEEWVKETFTIHADGTLTVEGDLNLSNLPVDHLPKGLKKIGGDVNFNNTEITSSVVLPQEIGGGLALSVTSAKGLILPTSIGGHLELCSLTSAEGLILPTSMDGLNLNDLTSAEGLILPTSMSGDLILSGLTSAKGLTLPTSIGGDLSLFSLTSIEGLTLPTSIGGSLYLNSLISVEGLILPTPIAIDARIHLDSLTSLKSLPSKEKISWILCFDEKQKDLKEEAERLGYRAEYD